MDTNDYWSAAGNQKTPTIHKYKPPCSECKYSHIYISKPTSSSVFALKDIFDKECVLECSLDPNNLQYYKYECVEKCNSVSCDSAKYVRDK